MFVAYLHLLWLCSYLIAYTSTASALSLSLTLVSTLLYTNICTSTVSTLHYHLNELKRFYFLCSLRTMPALSKSSMASTFSRWWSLPSYFCVNLWISLDSTFTCRSLWRSLFLTYQGAMTMFLSTFFWKRCIISILLCLVQPQALIICDSSHFSTPLSKFYYQPMHKRNALTFWPRNYFFNFSTHCI